jgi:DNA mismatch repair protein MLH3
MSLLIITSHHHEHRSHNTLSMHKSNIISRQVPAPAQQYLSHADHGTRVTVRDLFGSMPVRVMQRTVVSEKHGAGSKEWESLNSIVVLLCLAWPNSVAVTLRELGTNQRMAIRESSKIGPKTDVSRVCSILSQSSFIAPEERASWVSVGASTNSLDVSGTISLDPSPTKHVQFISFDIQPIPAMEGQSMLHDEINRLFLNSAFGNEEETYELDELERIRRANDARYKEDGYTNKELKGGKKGVDRWPKFYLNIQSLVSSTVSKCVDVEEVLDDKANSLSAVIQLLQVLVFEFLTRHHFRPKAARRQRSRTSQDVETGVSNVEHHPPQHGWKTVTFASSPAAKGASPKAINVEKKKSIMAPNSTSDLLGTNVKLPSFRKPSTSDFPFDAWSRIKSGTKKPALHNTSDISTDSEIHRPLIASPSLLSPAIRLKPLAPSTPLISSKGKVTRRPFDDIPPGPSQSTSTLLRTHAASSSQSKPAMSQRTSVSIDLTEDVDDDDDGTVTWINPITMVTSVVNKRTGHAVPAADKISFNSLYQSSSSPNVASRQKIHSTTSAIPSRPSPWLSSLLERWENPIFRPTEPSIPQISLDGEHEHLLHGHRHNCTQLDINRAFTEASPGIQGRISKSALRNAEVIGQVDRKFILVKPSSSEQRMDEKMLVIIDQHAADERIRVESLLTELCTPHEDRPDEMPNQSGIVTTYLENGIVFEASEGDIELLGKKRGHFANWGVCYDLSHGKSRKGNRKQEVTVRSLPPGIVERCKSDPKILVELIRTELYSNSKPSRPISTSSKTEDHSKAWLTRILHCPQGILDMINSRACRSAIMFNDVLSKGQCEALVRRLADTAFPFQCAHGRPSLLPLVEFGILGLGAREGKQDGDRFGREFRKWKVSLSS